MQIDLSVIFSHPDAVSNTIRYGRIDNIPTPTYYTIAGVTSSPENITVDNGQYSVSITPVYADGRTCDPTTTTTPSCPIIAALSATQTGSNIVVTYTALGSVPSVLVTVNFPNGGSFQQTYTNGNPVVVPIPSGVTGNATVYMQSICDPDTNFYSPLSAPVTVPIGGSTVNMTSDAVGIVITQAIGIAGFTMSSSLAVGGTVTGSHGAFTGAITFVFTGLPALTEKAAITVNGTLQECVAIPNTNGGTISFASATYYTADAISVAFNTGVC